MSWFRDALGPKEHKRVSGQLFYGSLEDAKKKYGDLATALQVIMDHALNAPDSASSGVREVGDRMVFQMTGVIVGVENEDHKIIGDHNAVDYEIEVRRVR